MKKKNEIVGCASASHPGVGEEIGGKSKEKNRKQGSITYKSGAEIAIKVIFGEDFGLPTRLLEAKTEESNNIEELADAIELIESYNEFKGKDVANALRQMHRDGLVMSISFGRESSPVLYVYPPYWNYQASNWNYSEHTNEIKKYTKEERAKMFIRIIKILEDTNPDELCMLGEADWKRTEDFEKAYCVRAWWD